MKTRGQITVTVLLIIALLVGCAAFGAGLAFASPARVWEVFLVNLLFWTGLAQGGVVFSATLYMCQARWGGPGLYRLAESGSKFLPVGFFLFWVLFGGRFVIFPWITHPIHEKSPYLNVPFMFARDGAGLFAMWILSWIFVRQSRRQQVVDWANNYESVEEAPGCVAYLAPIVGIAFVIVYCLLGIDLVMSLSPQWYDAMFPIYFAFGAYMSGVFGMGLLASLGKRPLRRDTSGERGGVLHDLGKLVFGAGSFWAYLLFAMYLVIWYGDIPKETFFAAPRVNYAPWGAIGWSATGLIFVLPFFFLMSKKAKQSPYVMGFVCFGSLVGVWMERYVLVTPSMSRYSIPFGWIEILVTIGFIGLFGLATISDLRMLPGATVRQAREEAA
ncbi:MAG: hypothetical protein ACREP6_07400 [Candidatus Binataceae bacterium]